MESDLAKVLHPLCGRPLLAWVLETARVLQPERVVAVVGHQADAVKDAVSHNYPNTEFALQSEMLGTGHAVQMAESTLANFQGDIIVTCGDAPLITADTFRALAETRRAAGAAASMLVSTLDEPGSYGRVIRSEGRVSKIVEAKDASDEERACRDVNAGTYCFSSEALWKQLSRIGNSNKSGEYYLTDVIGLLTEAGETVVSVDVGEREMTGVNTKAQLGALEAELQAEGVNARG